MPKQFFDYEVEVLLTILKHHELLAVIYALLRREALLDQGDGNFLRPALVLLR